MATTKSRRAVANKTLYTIGHSTHPIDEFIAMLKSFAIEKLIDVRTIPKSRFNPQFNAEALKKALEGEHIGYEHMAGLGGLRHALKDSVNQGWRNASFRGYADYMQTSAFEENLQGLIKEAAKIKVAVMCAEAVPWRCHRSMIADALVARGWSVRHIMKAGQDSGHKLNPMARRKNKKLYYPKEV
jgi:uncharacterized protein (DUF488 family)